LREIVLKKKKPRALFVQAHTVIENGEVVLKEFDSSAEGMVESYIIRFVKE
jgi:dipeptidyl-peptidase III